MTYYVERAAQTRLNIGPDGPIYSFIHEKRPQEHERRLYAHAMAGLFQQREAPPCPAFGDIFDSHGNLKHDVFDRAMTHINMQSSPGFPFMDCPTNADVDPLRLYEHVNATLKLWIADPITTDNAHYYSCQYDKRLQYFWSGHTFPASCFVKSEPTDVNKRARLIYGVSLIMNVISRILFGDFMTHIVESWGSASHKVGLDFSSEAGLLTFSNYVNRMYREKAVETVLMSDDIQGWEYQSRSWMHTIWHHCYWAYAGLLKDPTSKIMDLYRSYMLAEMFQLVLDSDGFLHSLPFYITLSGRATTHIQNSDERAALSKVDAFLAYLRMTGRASLQIDKLPEKTHIARREMTNGDDCCAMMHGAPEWSVGLGFVHTDVAAQTALRLNFSSQIFFRGSTTEVFRRKPDSLAKLVYNLLAADTIESAVDILKNFEQHEAYIPLMALHRKVWSRKLDDKDVIAQALLQFSKKVRLDETVESERKPTE